jgi:uncharacterized membrane protein
MKRGAVSFWPALIILTSLVTGGFYLAGEPSFARSLVALGFLLFCPGMAFVPLLQLRNLSLELPVGLALSLVLDTLVAVAALYLRAWHPGVVLFILIGLALCGAVFQLWQAQKVAVSR